MLREPLPVVRSVGQWCVLVVLLAIGPSLLVAETKGAAGTKGAKDAKPVPEVAAPKNVDQLQAIELQVRKLVAKVVSSTVAVQVGPGRASGVVVSRDGYVLTAGHVVGKPGQDVSFSFADGRTAKGKTLGVYQTADAGMMKITDKGQWPFVEMGKSGELKAGAWCLALGHPLGFQPKRPPVLRIGRILMKEERVIQTDCPLVGGDSGGPLFDLKGNLIGINSRISGSTTMNYHVPIDIFRQHWDRLVKGESWRADLPQREGGEVKAAFRQVVARASQCVVRVKCDGKDAALGTIVGPDGWILTKASELKGHVVCHLRDGRALPAQLVGIEPRFDLAMLKIDATGLPPIQWKTGKLAVGQWVAAPGTAEAPVALGILSVPQRTIPPASGVLGVRGDVVKTGVRIIEVLPKSPALYAGLKPNDVVTHVDGKPVRSFEEMAAAIKRHRPGERVKLSVTRGEKKLEISAKLADLDTPSTRKGRMQNRLGVGISRRHTDFPTVLQHDTVLRPVDCGGPLVDLTGKVVGVNIARGGRTETYSAPSDVLLMMMYHLMSGRLRPPQPEPKADEKPAPKAEKKPAPNTEPSPDKKPKPQPQTKPGPQTKPAPQKKPQPQTKPGPQKKPAPQKKPGPQK